MTFLRLWLAAFFCAAWCGCPSRVVDVRVKIVTASCQPPQPLEGATHLRLRVSGEGLADALEVTAPTASRELKLPDIPAGANRVVEVRAFDGDPKEGARLLSIGRSMPFTVPESDSAGQVVLLNVFLRRVNAFSPPSAARSPETCLSLEQARAGHTATLLSDGKVFIAGGFSQAASSARSALVSTELYDPATGELSHGPDLGLLNNQSQFTPLGRAFHTGTLLTNKQVLLWGGEEYGTDDQNGSAPLLRVGALLFDPEEARFGPIPSQNLPPTNARSHHAAARDSTGKVLLVGGITRAALSSLPAAADKVEWYDPATTLGKAVPGVVMPRIDVSVTPVQGGRYIAVAGGSDGVELQDEVAFFQYVGTSFTKVVTASPPRLRELRRSAGIAAIRDSNELVVVGGYRDPTAPRPLASSELVATKDSFKVSDGPSVAPGRGDLCTTVLPDGRVLMIGGRATDEFGLTLSSSTVQVLVPQAPGTPPTTLGKPDLPVSRYFHTCTLLGDGTVLVVGGQQEDSGTFSVTADVQIYTPDPLE